MSKKSEKMIKKKHVLIVGAGPSLKRYWDKIDDFINKNDVVTVACNRINHILTPDIHFWTDKYRYKKFGNEINKKSRVIFYKGFPEDMIRLHWSGDYEVIKYTMKLWKDRYDDPKDSRFQIGSVRYSSELKRFYGYFRTMGALSILWAHVNKASKISVVGMDGYAYFTKEELKSREGSQHCYGKGFSDAIGSPTRPSSLRHGPDKDKKSDDFYEISVKKDIDIARTLRSIEKYGAKFEILTPTVYKDYYNPDILNIKDERDIEG